MDMKDYDNLCAKIMLYTRVEISLQILKNTRADLDEAIRGKENRGVIAAKTSLVMSVDRYLDALHDYNNFLTGRLSGDAVTRYFENDIDATSKLIQTLKESM